jgi:hypothetical protein
MILIQMVFVPGIEKFPGAPAQAGIDSGIAPVRSLTPNHGRFRAAHAR